MPRMALVPRAARRTAALALFLLAATGDLHAERRTDVTDQLGIRSSGFRVDQRTGELVQAVTVTNTGPRPIEGKLHLVLDVLDPGIAVNGNGLPTAVPGSTFTLALPHSGPDKLLLKAGQSAISIIRFSTPGNESVRYRVRVLQDSSNP